MHPSNVSFIDVLYNDVLGGQESQSEQTGWRALLSLRLTPMAPSSVSLTSQEHSRQIVDQYYSALLGCQADTGGEANWVTSLLSGMKTWIKLPRRSCPATNSSLPQRDERLAGERAYEQSI